MDIAKIDGVEIKPIPGFEELYAASFDGRIWSYKEDDWVETFTHGDDICVRLMKEGENKEYGIHRLIAIAWIPSYGLEFVSHKDGDKSNNRVDNLYWKRAGIRVRCVETEQVWPTLRACAKDTGYAPGYIKKRIKDGIPTFHGLHFEEV